MQWILKLLLFTLCFWGTARFCKKQTGSFTLARITSQLAYHPEWDVEPLSELEQQDVKKRLSQPYYFLAKGAQSFVFSSEDGTTVLKFFRHHHLAPPAWLHYLPRPWSEPSIRKKWNKLHKDFTSYKLAYEFLRGETALLYLHLNKTSHLQTTVDLVDNLGIHHPVCLDHYEFILQKKATLTYSALEAWIKAGKIEEAKKGLTSLVKLLALRAKKQLSDKDSDLNTNFGFLGTEAVQIDVGRFKHQKEDFSPHALVRITDNLHQWLMTACPELDSHLRQEITAFDSTSSIL